jgi:hypothetical protein
MPLVETEFEGIGEWESESEAAERAPIRRPSSQPSFKPRPVPGTPQGVTQAQLEAALTRVDGKIKTVSDGIGTITARVNSLSTANKKEAEERKKSVEGQNKDLNQKLQLLALLPLLVQSPTATGPKVGANPLTDAAGSPIAAISVPDTSNLNALLPLLLVSGIGGTGGGLGLGDSSSGGEGGMSLLVLALALGRK